MVIYKKSSIIIFSLLILILGIALGSVAMYYLKSCPACSSKSAVNKSYPAKTKNKNSTNSQTLYNQKFPDVLDGTITIVSDARATIKTSDGKEYVVSPPRPVSYYNDSGVKTGMAVEARGKILQNNLFSLGYINGQATGKTTNK